MYTVFLADDELIIRQGLKCIIEWNELGFEIIGEASNGADALQFILNEQPDVVMMDIRMPKLTGLEVVKQAREEGYQGKIIILSGFSEFSYAKEAIRYGVEYYLTKPIDEDELKEVIGEIKQNLAKESEKLATIRDYRNLAKNQIISDLLTGDTTISEEEVEKLQLSAEHYQVVIYEKYNRSSKASHLLQRRFFCEHRQHTIGYDILPPASLENSFEISPALLTTYRDKLIHSLQASQRDQIAEIMNELEKKMYLSKNTIFEIILFFTEQFDMILQPIGVSANGNIMDDILHYIEHNYMDNIKLENIAPLFGYNSSYLGKIFSKKVGMGFNTYIDQVRIKHSKQLLIDTDLKVYEIAERVGYRNVDYFHTKFKKYMEQSPAEYRKANQRYSKSYFSNYLRSSFLCVHEKLYFS